MNLQEKTSEAWKRWSPELLIFALLLGFGFWINRGVELDSAVADGPNSVILEQVTNGLAVRMAVLFLVAGQVKHVY